MLSRPWQEACQPDPSAWVTSIFACVGGVQVAYAAFKSVGITDKWLDALLALGDIKED